MPPEPKRGAEGRVTIAVDAMTVSSARTPATRAPDNELYDRGCDLVEAATAIRRVADAPGLRERCRPSSGASRRPS